MKKLPICSKWAVSNWQRSYAKKKDVLFQFSDKLRRYNVKGKNLTGSLPIEKALGIFRETESNVVRLQIYFKDQSFARPSMLPIIS